MLNKPLIPHKIVSREEWLAARRALLAHEKEATRLRDKLNAERLALPWVKVDKSYVFDTPKGKKSLADLFAGRSQLIVYHFMLGPGWAAGCPGCSFLADHLDGALPHLEHHDVTLTAVSRAPPVAYGGKGSCREPAGSSRKRRSRPLTWAHYVDINVLCQATAEDRHAQ